MTNVLPSKPLNQDHECHFLVKWAAASFTWGSGCFVLADLYANAIKHHTHSHLNRLLWWPQREVKQKGSGRRSPFQVSVFAHLDLSDPAAPRGGQGGRKAVKGAVVRRKIALYICFQCLDTFKAVKTKPKKSKAFSSTRTLRL